MFVRACVFARVRVFMCASESDAKKGVPHLKNAEWLYPCYLAQHACFPLPHICHSFRLCVGMEHQTLAA